MIENLIHELYVEKTIADEEHGYFPSEILHGGAHGADTVASMAARLYDYKETVILPNYERYGKAAPLKRNTELVRKCDAVVAVYSEDRDRKGGTWDTVKKAIAAKKIVLERMSNGETRVTMPTLELF